MQDNNIIWKLASKKIGTLYLKIGLTACALIEIIQRQNNEQ
jgi:hypothetical protein